MLLLFKYSIALVESGHLFISITDRLSLISIGLLLILFKTLNANYNIINKKLMIETNELKNYFETNALRIMPLIVIKLSLNDITI